MELVVNQFRSLKQSLPAIPQPAVEASDDNNENGLGWFLLVIGYCLTSAIAISLEYWQLSSDHNHQKVPTSLLLLAVALVLAFAASFTAKIISLRHPNHGHARFLERLGIFFVAITFFIAITAPFPLYLKFISWFIFVASFLAIIIYMFMLLPGDNV